MDRVSFFDQNRFQPAAQLGANLDVFRVRLHPTGTGDPGWPLDGWCRRCGGGTFMRMVGCEHQGQRQQESCQSNEDRRFVLHETSRKNVWSAKLNTRESCVTITTARPRLCASSLIISITFLPV